MPRRMAHEVFISHSSPRPPRKPPARGGLFSLELPRPIRRSSGQPQLAASRHTRSGAEIPLHFHLEQPILRASELIIDWLSHGKKVLACGNGGGSADSNCQ